MFGGKMEELLIVLLIILLLFGAKKIPELARSIGSSVREVKKGLNGEDEEKKTAHTSSKSSEHKS